MYTYMYIHYIKIYLDIYSWPPKLREGNRAEEETFQTLSDVLRRVAYRLK